MKIADLLYVYLRNDHPSTQEISFCGITACLSQRFLALFRLGAPYTWTLADNLQGGKSTFCILFRLLTMQYKWRSQNAFPFPHRKGNAYVTATVTKITLRWQQCFFPPRMKLRGLLLSAVAVSLHYLPKMSAFNSHMRQNRLPTCLHEKRQT